MLAERFHARSEPFGARLRVMIGLLAVMALVLALLPHHGSQRGESQSLHADMRDYAISAPCDGGMAS